jgi:hypothetical protein
MGRKGHPLAARIKKIMQADEEVGKIAQATPLMIGESLGMPQRAWTASVVLQWTNFSLCGSVCCQLTHTCPLLSLQLVRWSCSCSACARTPAKLLPPAKPRL